MSDIEKQIERIKKMESNIDEVNAVMQEVIPAVSKLKRIMKKYEAVKDYYGSPAWYEDVQALDQGLLPPGLKAGILSQDEAFDTIGQMYQYAISQLEFVTKFLKNH